MNVTPQPRVYPAVYSGVGVFECMIRGIAVMRRRVDSYVNATQILKVAGIDKGRRTKILEKEILPGKHEIVQGGYGKYQGTWIPLDRGREVANQFGVATLLAPLFDHVPNPAVMGSLPPQLGAPLRGPGQLPPMPFPHMRPPPPYMIPYMPPNMIPGRPPIFPPGTPVYSPYQQLTPGPGGQPRLTPIYPAPPGTSMPQHPMMPHPFMQATGTPPIYVPVRSPSRQSTGQGSSNKRARDEGEAELPLSQGTDVTMVNGAEEDLYPVSRTIGNGAPPFKKARTDGGPADGMGMEVDSSSEKGLKSPVMTIDPKALTLTTPSTYAFPTSLNPSEDEMLPRPSTISSINRIQIREAIRKSTSRPHLYAAVRKDASDIVIRLLLEQPEDPMLCTADINAAVDDKGHTALHVAAALGKNSVVEALLLRGADVHRGNFRGETALMRAVLTINHYQAQTFGALVKLLRQSLRTVDDSKKTVLHHIAFVAGELQRVPEACYYLETILMWVGEHQGNRFDTFVDLQDENEDSALNIAARLGCRPVVKTLLACGARLDVPNRFGLRATDYGLLGENIEDHLVNEDPSEARGPESLYRPSEHVLSDMKTLVESMERDIASEKETKSAEYEGLQNKLREATRTLAEKRMKLEALRLGSKEVDDISERIFKLEMLRDGPDTIHWTGRVIEEKVSSPGDAFLSFRGRKSLEKQPIRQQLENEARDALDPSSPTANNLKSLIILRRMKLWHERTSFLLKRHQWSVEDVNGAELSKLEKIISLCTGLSGEELDQHVGMLLESVESETQDPGQTRLAAFMEKTRSLTTA
ncbi:transcriptional regulator swi6 [Serendipita sp. 399]|nr:transcriptional regulator swi6 [Serendipita sp. 399]